MTNSDNRGRSGDSPKHWFKKGHSGHSLGGGKPSDEPSAKRRAAAKSLQIQDDTLLKELLRQIVLPDGTKMRVIDLVARGSTSAAAKGQTKNALSLLKYGAEALRVRASEVNAEYEEALAQKAELFAVALRGHHVTLHPDQIVLCDDYRVRYLDTCEEAEDFRKLMTRRRLLPREIAQLDLRLREKAENPEELKRQLAAKKREFARTASYGFVEMPGAHAKVMAAAERIARKYFDDLRKALGEKLWARFEAGISFDLQ
jgi:hypothetical protein